MAFNIGVVLLSVTVLFFYFSIMLEVTSRRMHKVEKQIENSGSYNESTINEMKRNGTWYKKLFNLSGGKSL